MDTLQGCNEYGLFGPDNDPAKRPLSAETIRRLKADFPSRNHHPSPAMWAAILEIVHCLEDMAEGRAEPKVHLASLDPGVGKTQTVVQFLAALCQPEPSTNSIKRPSYRDCTTLPAAIVCAGRLDQIRAMVDDAKSAGLRDDDFAVYSSDDTLNAMGRGIEDCGNARVLFTTHAMVLRRCEGKPFAATTAFHFKHTPREVRVWDEACTPGTPITLSVRDLPSLGARLGCPDLHGRLIILSAELLRRRDGERIVFPDLVTESGFDLNDLMHSVDDASEDLKTAASALWFLSGKTVTVRNDRIGNAILDYRETLPEDIAPLLVLDASVRVRETYKLWEILRGGVVRLTEAPKDYSPLTVHVWSEGGGKSAYKDADRRHRIIQGVAATVDTCPTDKWLIVHHKDASFEAEVRALLSSAADVAFIHWGAHDATNAYAERPRVILAGTLFLRPSQYEAIGRVAAGITSFDGGFDAFLFEMVRRGEHRHFILQAACRGLVRKCDGERCPRSHLYLIASKGSGIGNDLPNVFPGAAVQRWLPVERKLSGKVGVAVSFILEKSRVGSFVSDRDVMKHIGEVNKANYNRRIKKHEDLREVLAEHGIQPCKQGRLTGFQHLAATHFGDIEE
jgi:hypothetical protein